MTNLREARRTAYREMILLAAENVFAEYGFDGTRISMVADAAGVSVGTLYGVFEGKAELFTEVLIHRLPEILERSTAAAASASDVLDSLVVGMDAYVGYMLEHPDWLRIHLREHAWGLGPTRGAPTQLAAWRDGMNFHASVLEVAMKEGTVVECDPVLLARSISALHQIHLDHWLESGMQEPPDIIRKRLCDLFRLFFCADRGTTRARDISDAHTESH